MLYVISGGATKLISSREHRFYLLRAFREANLDVVIVVPWLEHSALDKDVLGELENALKRCINVTVVYGLGTKTGGHQEQARAKSRNAITVWRNMAKRIPDSKLKFIEKETHEKFLFCDSKFATIGSYNWLSAAAAPDHRESTLYTEKAEIIELLKTEYKEMFTSQADQSNDLPT